MSSSTGLQPVARATLWTGRVMSALVIVFMLMDGVMKLVKPEPVVTATVNLGYQESVITPLGIVLIACTVIYIIPRTAILGAILLTGYLGGAVASHLRHGDDLFPVLFPVVFGVLIWGGLYLRDPSVRAMVPIRK
jgi:DoxX-like family